MQLNLDQRKKIIRNKTKQRKQCERGDNPIAKMIHNTNIYIHGFILNGHIYKIY